MLLSKFHEQRVTYRMYLGSFFAAGVKKRYLLTYFYFQQHPWSTVPATGVYKERLTLLKVKVKVKVKVKDPLRKIISDIRVAPPLCYLISQDPYKVRYFLTGEVFCENQLFINYLFTLHQQKPVP